MKTMYTLQAVIACTAKQASCSDWTVSRSYRCYQHNPHTY